MQFASTAVRMAQEAERLGRACVCVGVGAFFFIVVGVVIVIVVIAVVIVVVLGCMYLLNFFDYDQ